MRSAAIAIRDLHIAFNGVPAVQDVSFDVQPQECVGLVGESGSGKSTILRAIIGLTAIAHGEVLILGAPPDADRRQRARNVQMVFQDPFASLHPRQTIGRILEEPLRINGVGDRDSRVVAALDAVALPVGFRFRYPHQLSGGQRQRVAIARALILEPRILLLDEPTSALDVSVQAEVLNLLKDLQAARGFTMLLVGHDLGVVAHMCSRILVLEKGRLKEEISQQQLHAGSAQDPYSRKLLRAAGAAAGHEDHPVAKMPRASCRFE